MDRDGERRAKYRKVCEQIEGLSAAHARCLAKMEDQMGAALKQWPDDARTKMLSSRADFKARFSLFLFTVGNVCPPELFVDWVILRRMLRYQESAAHLIEVSGAKLVLCSRMPMPLHKIVVTAQVIKSHKTGKLEQQGKTYWDVKERAVKTIITPTFAAEVDPSHYGDLIIPAGSEFWDAAIRKLEAHACTLPREPMSY